MKKKPFLFASCLLSLGIYFSFAENSKAEIMSKDHIVTKDEAHQKANHYIKGVSKQAYPNWKDAQIGASNTLYDLDGNITGYVFQIEKNNEEHGYIIANGKNNGPSIIESTRAGANPYKNIEEGKAIYTGPLQHLKKENDKIIDLHTNQNVEKLEEKKQLEVVQNYSFSAPKVERFSNKPKIQNKLINNVPDYQWYRGCSPTAIANLVAYWSQYYNNLLRDDETPHQLIDNLGDMMGTDKNKGATEQSKMAPGIQQYWKSRGYNVETQYDTQPTYEKFKKEIDLDRPIIVNLNNDSTFSDHTVTGVGYMDIYIPELNETNRDITVHDTWYNTPVDVIVNFDQIEKNITDYITVNPSKIDPKLLNFKMKTEQVHYNWGDSGPLKSITDNFTATFDQTQQLHVGDYFIQTQADDRVFITFDGKKAIDRWTDSNGEINRKTLLNVDYGLHSMTTKFYENTGKAGVFSDLVPFDTWLAYYYPNKNLEGLPIDAKVIKPKWEGPGIEKLYENSGNSSPTPNVSKDGFSARYTTYKRLPEGEYLIRSKADDGIRVLIDGKVVLDRWTSSKYREDARKITIKDVSTSGTNDKDVHCIEVQYFEDKGASQIEFQIQDFGNAYTDPNNKTWIAAFYNNKDLKGDAIVKGGIGSLNPINQLDFNWGNSSPDTGIQSDNFSAFFSKFDDLEPGQYEFEVTADDGVIVSVNNQKIINSWVPNGNNVLKHKRFLSGQTRIDVKYLELTGNSNLKFNYKKVN